MDINALKIELMQKIIACNDDNLLAEIEVLLKEVKLETNEPGESYKVEKSKDIVPENIYAELDEDFKAYKRGELKAEPWEKVERELRQKYGF